MKRYNQRRLIRKAIIRVMEDPEYIFAFERLARLAAEDPIIYAFFLKHRVDLKDWVTL